MEIVQLSSTKNELKIEIKGESHSLCNVLSKELWNDSSVKSAGYMLESTMEENPILTVVTSGKSPVKALTDAAARLLKKLDEFESKFKKISK